MTVLMLSGLSFAQTAPPPGKPVCQIELTALLATGSTSARLARLVQERGIDFTPDEAFLKSLQDDGAEGPLITALKSAKVKRERTPAKGPAKAMKDSAALAHLHRAAQLNRNNFHLREAEPEFREAVNADPANPYVHLALGEILAGLGKTDAAIAEYHAALKLQSDLWEAHLDLGNVLLQDPTQNRKALEQLRQAVTLVPSDAVTHFCYGVALDSNGDKKGGAEQRKIASGWGDSLPPFRIHVVEEVVNRKLISQPLPHYPQKAKAAHIEGTVRMDVLIARDGAVMDIEVISGDALLYEAAAEAVRMWRYQTTLLNGQPVEVVSEVDVNFTLE
jgi:TonB family protein